MTKVETEGDRKSVATPPAITSDPVELAKKEASNGLRQFDAVVEYIEQARSAQAFSLRPSMLLRLNRIALEGINTYAGNYRPSAIYITEANISRRRRMLYQSWSKSSVII